MNAPLLTIENVRLGYDRHTVLDDVTLHLAQGDILGLVGPNGAGKTTLLHAILGTLDPFAGSLTWTGGRRARIGYVPQRERLDTLWPMTVLDLALMGRCALCGPGRPFTRADREAARDALHRVGLEGRADAHPGDLSGGQVQRALIARALAGEPELLIMDEPTSGMDLAGSSSILALIRALHATDTLTLIIVSHDLGIVSAIATRIALIHDGRLREGEHDELLSAETLSAVYGMPIQVARSGGVRAIFPPTTPPENGRP